MTFDYIIIGGGTSGSILAHHLSKKKYKVAIIEKGNNFKLLNKLIEFPSGNFIALKNKIFTKNYLCESSSKLNGRRLLWPRGEYLGGSSAINGLIYKRAHKKVFDSLYNKGFTNWEWKKVNKYYEEIEKDLNILSYKNTSQYKNWENNIVNYFLDSLKENNFKFCNSFNETSQHVSEDSLESIAAHYDFTLNNFKRSYGYNTFLKNNKSIKIFGKSLVTKVLFENSMAKGVEFINNNNKSTVYCNREIILSAGTINSPKILQLSGIGDKNLLDSLGIRTIFDNKNVGINLRDRLQTRTVYEVNSKENYNILKRSFFYLVSSIFKYYFFKRGILSMPAVRAGAFVGTTHGEKDLGYQLNLILGSVNSNNNADNFNGITISVNTLDPKSSGYLKIKSKNPYKDPEIQANYFENEDDLQKHVDGIEIIRKISKTNPFSELIKKEHLPGPLVMKKNDIIDYIKNTSTTIYHPTGTCRIGNEKEGVIDGKMKVFGVKNLRVCDASIFPESLSGNPAASCYLVGKILAEDILSS